jgi:hypothetical protein
MQIEYFKSLILLNPFNDLMHTQISQVILLQIN